MVSMCANAQRISIEAYIEQYKDIAISEMKRSGVPASITLAQGILETENGNSELVKKSNNHFGIKCKNNWEGDRVSHDDDANGECFRSYNKAEDSFRDHSDFLRNSKRYSSLFSLDAGDYEGWAKGLKNAGYATNPHYPVLLIKYIEQYDLQQYSLAVINEMPEMDISKSIAGNDKTLPVKVEKEGGSDAYENPVVSTAPDKISRINKTKCVFIKKGISLLAIATRYQISLNKLMEFNDLEKDGILTKDQYIYLHKKQKTGNQAFYITQAGESLYDIAQKNGIQLKSLREYNHLNIDAIIDANTKLYLQPDLSVALSNTGQSKFKIHQVAPNEGLYTIARNYKVTVKQLKEWNKLMSDELKIGQEIIVSK